MHEVSHRWTLSKPQSINQSITVEIKRKVDLSYTLSYSQGT